MGATLADLDGDGRVDWFMTNIYLPKGSPGCANTLYRGLGVVEGLTKVFYPQASSVSIFVIMIIVLLIKPAGLFGKVR
jgi:hypothetical protein